MALTKPTQIKLPFNSPKYSTDSSATDNSDVVDKLSPISVESTREIAEKRPEIDEEAQGGDVPMVSDPASNPPPGSSSHLSGVKLMLVIVGLLLAIFLVVLDRAVVATAIPVISSRFNEFDKSAWIATSYFLTQAGFILAFGQALTIAGTKEIFLLCLAIFELGSLIAGAAPSFNVLIFGRALSGVGAGGLFVSSVVVIAQVSPLDRRPMIYAWFGFVLAAGSVSGPLIGGALSDFASWRWCFYMNLPIGALTALTVSCFFKSPPRLRPANTSDRNTEWEAPLWKRIMRLDWLGNVLYLGTTICLLLALEWGGVQLSWSDKIIIILLCLFGFFFVCFVLWEWRLGSRAVLPLCLFHTRMNIALTIQAFVMMFITMLGTYYLPVYYQAARSQTAIQAGINVLPFMLSIVVGNWTGGGLTTRTGRPKPVLVLGPLIATLVSGLLFWTLIGEQRSRSSVVMIILQLVLGFGIGICVQLPGILIQAVYRNETAMIPQACAMLNATQMFGGVIGVALAGTILNNRLQVYIPRYAPDIPPELMDAILQSVSAIRDLDDTWKEPVKRAYTEALGFVFMVGVPTGGLAALASIFIKDISLKK